MTDQATKAPCNCGKFTGLNEGRQRPEFVEQLENPVVLLHVIDQPSQTFRGSVSKLAYKAGGRIKYICVDSRDAPELLTRHRGRNPIFRLFKPMPMIAEAVEPEAVDGDTGQDEGLPPSGGLTVTPEQVVKIISSWNGVGEGTAQKLVTAGYSHYSLSEIPLDDDEARDEVSEIAEIPKSLATVAIAEAHKWRVDVKAETE